MKKRTLLFTSFAVLMMFTSCLNGQKDETGGQFFSFVTVSQEDEGVQKLSFLTDDDVRLIPTNISQPLKVSDGRRAMAYFYLTNPEDAERKDKLKDVQIILSQLDTTVKVSPVARVADMDAAFALGNNGLSLNLNPYYPFSSDKFFNFYVCANVSNLDWHKFYLTHADDAGDTAEELQLTLVHDDGNDVSQQEMWFWLSFPVDELRDLFADRKYAVVSLKTRTEGVQQVRLQLPE